MNLINIVILAALFVSCSKLDFNRKKSDDAKPKKPFVDNFKQLPQSLSFAQFENCQELTENLRISFQNKANSSLDSQLESFVGYSDEGDILRDVAVESAASPEANDDSPSSEKNSSGSDYTKTNNQESGVEEGDLVLTDGNNIFVGLKNSLKIYNTDNETSIAAPKIIGFSESDEVASLVLLENSQILVLLKSRGFNYDDIREEALAFTSPNSKYIPQKQFFSVKIIDYSQLTNISIIKSYKFSGRYEALRLVGNVVRIISTNSVEMPEKFSTYVSQYDSVSRKYVNQEEFSKKIAQQKITNEASLAEWNLENFIQEKNSKTLSEGEGEVGLDTSTLTDSCKNIYIGDNNISISSENTTVTSINLSSDLVDQNILMERSSNPYFTGKNLYLSKTIYNYSDSSPQFSNSQTNINKISFGDSLSSTYKGNLLVEGVLLNRYSLSEFNGNLRIATTINGNQGRFFSESNTSNSFDDQSFDSLQRSKVYVAGEKEDGTLGVFGSVDGLGIDERIYSVRFNGPIGYVVTFRQVDPLYTLDLSDPSNPVKVGELKVPGFSTYMHILSNNQILAVGRNGNANGTTGGVKLSLFDVSNLAEPKEVSALAFDSSSYTEAAYNPKAFTYDAKRSFLALAMSDNVSSKVIGVKVQDGLLQKTHNFSFVDSLSNKGNYYRPALNRALMIGDNIFTVTGKGIRVYQYETGAELFNISE